MSWLRCAYIVWREWEYFDSDKPCPFHYTESELQQHYDAAETFNESQAIWKELEDFLTNEGYTPNEDYGKAIELLKNLRTAGLTHLGDKDRDEYDRMTQWILDLKVPA